MNKTLIVATTILAIVSPGNGQEASARWIMEQNYEQNRVEDMEAEFVMKLIHPKGHERIRQVVLYAKTNADGLDKSLIRFMSPADVRGVGLLSIDTPERENQWLYLPALQRVRRISSSQKSDSFMSSDFSYEDLESRELEDYEYTLSGVEELDGIACYRIQAQPIERLKQTGTTYSRLEMWIEKEHFLAVKVNLYDLKSALLKTMKLHDIRQIEGSEKWRGYVIEMQNVKTGHRTELRYASIKLNSGLEDDLFTERTLTQFR
ncbi:outer membrane lipoprotein-sorting protein [Candidatus Neomarinimicrobiota bacterium]